jgi:hypothetical protein
MVLTSPSFHLKELMFAKLAHLERHCRLLANEREVMGRIFSSAMSLNEPSHYGVR